MPEKKVTKYFTGRVKSYDVTTNTADVIISDETKDRCDEVVLVESFKKTKKDFMKHPVLLSSHAYRGLLNQIGKFSQLSVNAEAKEVVGRIEYFKGAGNPEADWAAVLAEKGIAAFSIGFIPKSYKDFTEEERVKNGGVWREYSEIELLEVSQVLIPANPSALMKSFGDTKDDAFISELSAKIFEVFNEKEVPEEIKWEGDDQSTKDPTDEKVKGELLPEVKGELEFEEECKAALAELKQIMLEQKEMIAEAKALIAEIKMAQLPPAPPEAKKEDVIPEVKKEDADGVEANSIVETLGEEKMAELRLSLFGENKSSNIEDLKVIFSKMTDEAKGIFSVQQ